MKTLMANLYTINTLNLCFHISWDLVFETMAAQYVQVRIHRGSVPFLPQQIGHWWGTNSATKKQVEIDLVAMADIQAIPMHGLYVIY